eukprot:m.31660 g.31660  ORF g.31660 m.31660 type:complete len:579 (-) comp5385_c0_seq1:1640-3376(-)
MSTALRSALLACTLLGLAQTVAGRAPNIVFLVVESTDGRTWTPGYQNDVIPLPNIRQLQANGTAFVRHYSNTPVCCPSRATFWSGRHAHHIPHEHNGMLVRGAWNNYEGLPHNFSARIDQVLADKAGYATKIIGKTDWKVGDHSLDVRLNSWTMYTHFPYNLSTGGWHDETDDCLTNGTVHSATSPTSGTGHEGDWLTLDVGLEWIRGQYENHSDQPFFLYQGMNIVHPPYVTNQYWYNKIDPNKIDVPSWLPFDQMHPCDLMSSMLKNCIPPADQAEEFYSLYRRRNIRRIYYAMIAEFDAMVGAYMAEIRKLGIERETVFIVTSDHGDMQMERQQFYKMVPYQASASVPMVIYDGRNPLSSPITVDQPTQLIDIFPTVMELAGVSPAEQPDYLEGYSLVPLLQPRVLSPQVESRPPFVVTQFHGTEIAMSWFAIIQQFQTATYKLIVWGTGGEIDNMLFDLTHDDAETTNLIHSSQHKSIVTEMLANLNTVVSPAEVALDVATYNQNMFKWWVNSTGPAWQQEIHAPMRRWTKSWNQNSTGAFLAIQEWLSKPPQVVACRDAIPVYPPQAALASHP